MSILLINFVSIIVITIININFLASFEVAFIGTLLIIYSSYKTLMKKLDFMANLESIKPIQTVSNNITDSKLRQLEKSVESKESNLPKKERFVIGFKLSIGIFRILSYTLLAFGVIALINNKIFFIIPFMLGIIISSISSIIFMYKKFNS
ncbi:hypothetical protein [Helicobacter sp. MIT 14-3879]|uniref:hypothetical protein n=1 Tax=Helicobacter sp. MIT 14-3879 TaxID=2040649 RepID=UPI000E1EDD90|nr:hypothetical protein [Helicobacter sp. MIT 14-3879]RDU65232.1 hypothetical protein CQA44_02665 [Helicobacter sp. MIT 14-3879]